MTRKKRTAPLVGAPARYRGKGKNFQVRMTELGRAAAETGAARMAAQDGLRVSLADYFEYLTRKEEGLTTHTTTPKEMTDD